MNKKSTLLLKVLYVVISLLLLIYTLASTRNNPDAGIVGLFLIISMTILSFPSGLAVLFTGFAVLGITGYIIGAGKPASTLSWKFDGIGLIIMWVGFLVAGYYQWFIVTPRIMAKRKKKSMGETQ
jgi:membrane-bound ClpP family serine protease